MRYRASPYESKNGQVQEGSSGFVPAGAAPLRWGLGSPHELTFDVLL